MGQPGAKKPPASVRPPQCHGCAHYRVTWQPARPHGCEAMGFISRQIPSQVVYESSGVHCQLFEPKAQRRDTRSRRRGSPDTNGSG